MISVPKQPEKKVLDYGTALPQKKSRRPNWLAPVVLVFVGVIALALDKLDDSRHEAMLRTYIKNITPFKIANLVEAVFWTAIGVVFGIFAIRKINAARQRFAVAGVTLFLFGLSDIVESETGAWWRPWWLLLWKGVCIIILAALFILYRREKQRESHFRT